MTVGIDSANSIARSLASLRRRQQRSALAGTTPIEQIYASEVADVVQDRTELTTVGDIARELTLDPSQASRRVRSAVEFGLVTRISVQHDGRLSGLQLTVDGNNLLGRIQERRGELIQEATKSWTSADQARLAHLLDRLVHDLGSNTAS